MTSSSGSYPRRLYAELVARVGREEARRVLADYLRRRDQPLEPPPTGWDPHLGVHSGLDR